MENAFTVGAAVSMSAKEIALGWVRLAGKRSLR